jgi:hypothetical protein
MIFEKGEYVTYSASLGKPMMTRFTNVILIHSKKVLFQFCALGKTLLANLLRECPVGGRVFQFLPL